MCGRYGLFTKDGIVERYNISNHEIEIPLNYNNAPGMTSFVVTRNSPNKGELMGWGLVPPWLKDIRQRFSMINAKAETVAEKPAYRNNFKNKRCLVPFNCFYEWKGEGKTKTPFLFHDKKEKYLSFAGLYEIAHDAEGKEIRSFTIITTAANKLMHGVHERMPVILTREEEEVWLEKDSTPEQLTKLLDGFQSKTFESYEISKDVGNASNNFPSIIEPVATQPTLLD